MKSFKKIKLHKQKQRGVIVIFVLVLMMTITSCDKKQESTETEVSSEIEEVSTHAHTDSIEKVTDLQITSKQFKAAGIELGNLQETGLTELLKANGTLDVPPQSTAEVAPYIGGVVRSIGVVQGDFVKKGQGIITLEHPDYIKLQESYVTIKSELDYLEKEYLRQKSLYDDKVNSGKTFQLAESNFNSAKGKLSSLERQLSMLNISIEGLDEGNISQTVLIRAPINGYVSHIHATLGSYAEPNKPLLDIIDNSKIQVNLEIFETDLNKVKVGQKFSCKLTNQDNAEIDGTITKITKNIDNNSKSISVKGRLNNTDNVVLIPGVFVNATIEVGNSSVTAVPEETIVRSGKNQYVFIVDRELVNKPPEAGKDPYSVKDANGNIIPLVYKMIEVKTGMAENDLIEISPYEEIKPEDRMVVKGAYYLISALKSGETVGCCAPAEEEKKE